MKEGGEFYHEGVAAFDRLKVNCGLSNAIDMLPVVSFFGVFKPRPYLLF
jgi:hypothetical protein